jgi:hypothetical protein
MGNAGKDQGGAGGAEAAREAGGVALDGGCGFAAVVNELADQGEQAADAAFLGCAGAGAGKEAGASDMNGRGTRSGGWRQGKFAY